MSYTNPDFVLQFYNQLRRNASITRNQLNNMNTTSSYTPSSLLGESYMDIPTNPRRPGEDQFPQMMSQEDELDRAIQESYRTFEGDLIKQEAEKRRKKEEEKNNNRYRKKFNDDDVTRALLDSMKEEHDRRREVEKNRELINMEDQENPEMSRVLAESLQTYKNKQGEDRDKQGVAGGEIYEDEELQRILSESFKQTQGNKTQTAAAAAPSQKIDEDDDNDIEKAILMSMENYNPPKTNLPFENPKENSQQVEAPQQSVSKENEAHQQEEVNDSGDDSSTTEMEDRELSEYLEGQIKIEEEKRQLNERRLHVRAQDDAYETSVAMDRSKEEFRKELERKELKQIEELKRQEELKEQAKKDRENYLKKIEQSLPMEPSPNDPNAIHITFRLPNGDRFSRFFLKSSTLKQVKDFVDSQELQGKSIPLVYNFITDFPKQIWNNLDLHLQETNFQKRQLLRIEPIEN